MESHEHTAITVEEKGTGQRQESSVDKDKYKDKYKDIGELDITRNKFAALIDQEQWFIDIHSVPTGSSNDLGRDDEVWPCYVKEAEEWDDRLMKKWNRYSLYYRTH